MLRFGALVSLIVATFATTARANPFDDPEWRVVPSVLIGLERFDYHEEVPAPLVSKHDGTLPTTRLAVEVRSPRDRWYARVSFGITDGSMTYVGSDQQGNPLSGPTSGYMTDSEGVVGWRGLLGPLWIGANTGLGHRTWQRDLRPSGPGGYLEEYGWSYVPLTFTLDAMASRRVQLSFEGTMMVPFGSDLRAHFSEIDPTYSDLDIGLANDLGFRTRLSGTVELTRELHALASFSFEATHVLQGPSTPFLINGVQATDANGDLLFASEPPSKTYRTTFVIGAEYAF